MYSTVAPLCHYISANEILSGGHCCLWVKNSYFFLPEQFAGASDWFGSDSGISWGALQTGISKKRPMEQ